MRHDRVSRRRAVLALAIVFVAVVAVIAVVAGRGAGRALIVTRPIQHPDAILALASHEWERLPEAAARAREWPSARVLLSVPRVVTEHNCHRCAERGDWLVALGVDSSRLRLLPRSVTNTRDEAIAALAFSRRHGVGRLLIVTSPYHTRRALAAFDEVFEGSGVEVGVQPSTAYSAARPDRWWRTPYDRWYVRYEWSAIAYYAVRYGIIAWP